MIDQLAAAIAARTPLDEGQARQVLAGALSLIRQHAAPEKVGALLAAIPGAAALADSMPIPKAGGLFGGLMGAVGGGAMADGMAMLQNLAKDGITTQDLQAALPAAADWLREHAGTDVLNDAVASIPGAGALLGKG